MTTIKQDKTSHDERLRQDFRASPQGQRCERFSQAVISSDALLIEVRDAVLSHCASLDPLEFWKAQELCGDRLWQRFDSAGMHRAMGLCLSFLAHAGEVPLTCVNPGLKGSKWYLITPIS